MREISAVATLIHAAVSVIFEEHSAVTLLQLPHVKVVSAKLSTPLPSPASGEFSSAGGAWDYSEIVFFCCDDDK